MADVKIMSAVRLTGISIPEAGVLVYNDKSDVLVLSDGVKTINELTADKIKRLGADANYKRPEPVLGDVNGDGVVDNKDLSILMTEKNKASKGKKKPAKKKATKKKE